MAGGAERCRQARLDALALDDLGDLGGMKKRRLVPQRRHDMQIIFPNAGITPIRCDGRRRPLATLSARLPELP